MRWAERVPLALLLGIAGCTGGRAAGLAPPPSAAAVGHDLADQLGERATLALAADSHLERADSLYARDAEVIAQGQRRSAPPRFAGIEAGGEVAVGTTRVEVSGELAWTLVEYRWVALGRDLIREAHATLVFARQPDGRWQVVHAHSSLLP